MPTVSIILPTYNGADFIAKAIESVLSQTYSDWELLILSDGSADQTSTIVERFCTADPRVIFIENEKNLGIQKTLNKGISLAQGSYIARLDDDDRWIDPNKLALQVSYMDTHPEYVLMGTDAVIVDTSGKQLSLNIMPKSNLDIRMKILSKNCFLHATVLIRKSALDKVGAYSEDSHFLHAEDYELWLRLGTIGSFCNLRIAAVQLTNHAQSITSKNRILQAKNILHVSSQYRKRYPHFVFGYTVALARYCGFVLLKYVPVPKELVYAIQRAYRKI